MEQPKTRQELYDLIRSQGRQEFILEEMKRLGFWETNEEKPSLPEVMIKRQNELRKEINELVKKQKRIENPEALLKTYRKKRLEESRKKQQENLEKRAAEKKAKAAAWQERKTKEILYLGDDISFGLADKKANLERLEKYGLSNFEDAGALAKAMNIPVPQLQFLAYNRRVSKTSHYQRFYMKKKSGGQRLIAAPMPRLKSAQYWILEEILNKIPVHEKAHGFKAASSIVTNAQPHVGQDVVVNLDFKDFFPTINFYRVKGAFQQLGYSSHIATIFGSICTEPDVDQIEMDGVDYFVADGPRVLPQGAPTSPVLTNIICYKMDTRFQGLAKKYGFQYSRYADDLTFSASGEAVENLTNLLWGVRQVTKAEGFVLHPEKLRIMRKGARQEVTGIVVNRELGVNRQTMRKFRALLHQIKQSGWNGKSWGKSPNLVRSVEGYAQFVSMVKPKKGQELLAEVDRLKQQWNVTTEMFSTPTSGNLLDKEIKKEIKEQPKKQDDKKDDDSSGKPGWKLW